MSSNNVDRLPEASLSPSAARTVRRLQARIAQLESSEQRLSAQLEGLRGQQTALEEKQERLAALFKALPDLAFVLDEDGRYIEVLAEEDHPLLYESATTMRGRTLEDVLPPRVARAALASLRRALATNQTQTLEYWLDVPAGRFWFEGRTAPIHSREKDEHLVVWIARDVTARKEAEEALRESQRLYALAAVAGQVGIWEYDMATETLYLDQHARTLLGYAEDDPIEWSSIVFPEDAEALRMKATEHLAGQTPAFDYVCKVKHRDGTPLWILTRGSVAHRAKKEAPVLIGTMTVITERRKAELARERLLTMLQRRNIQMQTAAEVSSAIGSILDPQHLVQQVVNLIRDGFDLYYVGLFLVDRSGRWTSEPGHWAVLRAGTGEVGRQMVAEGHRLEIGGPSMIGWCIANRQARISLDVGEEQVHFENPWLPKTRSELALPLISRGEAIGALTIQSDQEAAFTEKDITVLQTMADQMANAIVNTWLYEQAQQEIAERRHIELSLRQRQRELELLNSATRALIAPLDLSEVLCVILQKVHDLLGVMACSVWLVEPDTGQLVCHHATGAQSEVVIGWTLEADQGIAGWVLQSGESLIVKDTRRDPRHFEGVAKKTGLEIRSILCVPLKTKEAVLGVLQVVDTKVGRFHLSDLQLIESLATTAAIAIENARLYEQAQQDAATKTALLDEANHRVKNNLTAIMGLLALELQKPYDQTDDFRALLRDLLNRIQGMATVHSLLSEIQWQPLPLKCLTEEVLYAALGSAPNRQSISVRVHAPPEPLLIVPRQATSLAILLNELVTNSIKHAFREQAQGTIVVQIDREDETLIVLRYRDNGPGWPEEVLEGVRLGVGVRLMRLIAEGPMLQELTFSNDDGAEALLTFKLIPC